MHKNIKLEISLNPFSKSCFNYWIRNKRTSLNEKSSLTYHLQSFIKVWLEVNLKDQLFILNVKNIENNKFFFFKKKG